MTDKTPSLGARIKSAWKALTYPVAQSFGYTGSSTSGLSQMPGWIGPYQGYKGTQIDYANEVGDLTSSSLVMAAVNFHGTTLPEAPIQVLEVDDTGTSKPVIGHPLVGLINQPNPFYPGELLWKAFSISWLISGNVYWLKRRNTFGKVIELWPWPDFLVRPVWPRSEQDVEKYNQILVSMGWSTDRSDFIAWYELSDGRGWYPVKKEDIVHFRSGIDPRNTRMGLAPLASILREIYTDNQRANLMATLMRNCGIVPWMLVPADKDFQVDAESRAEIKEEIMSRTTADESGKPLVFSGPFKVEKLALSPEEMVLEKLSIIPETRLSAVTGIPAIVLNFWAGLLRGTYANYEQAKKQAYEAKIIPDQRLISGTLRTQLLPEFEKSPAFKVHFDLKEVKALQDDENKRAARFGQLYRDGVLMRSEARAGVGKGASSNIQGVDDVFFDPRGGSVIKPGDDIIGGQTPDAQKSVKSVPSSDEQEKAVEWWEECAPEEAADLINAKKANGDSEVIA